MTVKINTLPEQSTMHIDSISRAIGRLVEIELPKEPGSVADADLVKDVFQALNRKKPEYKGVDEVPRDRLLNHKVMEWLEGSHGLEQTRDKTANNIPASIATTKVLHDLVTSEDAIKKAQDFQKQIEEAEKERKSQEALSNAFGNMGDQEQAGNAAQLAQAAAEKAKQVMQMLQDQIDGIEADEMTMTAIERATQKAEDEADKVKSAMAGWGFSENGEGGSRHTVSPQEAMEFIAMNTDDLAEIGELLGRLKGVAANARRAKVRTGEALYHVTETKDLRKVFTSEIIKLSHKMPLPMRTKQVKKWRGRGLLGFEQSASDEDGRGMFYAYVDRSGSMSSRMTVNGKSYTAETVALAAALGVAKATAEEDDRFYTLVPFTSSSDDLFNIVTSDDNWKRHIEWVQSPRSGFGTNFNMALNDAMSKIPQCCQKHGIEGGIDLLFITDGIATLDDKTVKLWEKFSQEYNVRLLTIIIGFDETFKDTLTEISDKVIYLKDSFTADELTRQIAGWAK